MNISQRMNDLIGGAVAEKDKVGRKLEAVGGQIRKNIDQGQTDLKSGKIGRYDTINPLKGTIDAYKKGK